MDYRKINDVIYARMDPGDEIISCILEICEKEQASFATYTGIGGCGEAEIQTYIPDQRIFETRKLTGLLELVSMTGSMTMDEEGKRYHHTHAAFAYQENGEHAMAAGHMKSMTVSITAEIEIRPVYGNAVRRKYDEETGTGFWEF